MEFKYIPLDESKDEIRLLNLHPGENDSSIRCTLENVPLGEYSIHEEGIYKWSGGGVGWAPPKSSETFPSTYVGITTPSDPDEWIPLQWDTIGSQEEFGSSSVHSDRADYSRVNSNTINLPRFFGKQPDMTGLSVVPDFEALSYTWGDAKATKVIKINGVSFLVTPNLFEALKRLRKGNRDRVLWIDAICINQGDLVERSRQVRRMPSIYQRAWRVVVWLGDGADGSDRAIEALQSIGGKEKTVKELEGWIESSGDWYGPQFNCFGGALGDGLSEMIHKRRVESLRILNLTTPVEFSDEDWRALNGFLLECVYWNRAWIIQELTYARSAKLYCGLKSMGWDTFSHITYNEKLLNPRNLSDKRLIARFANLVNESNVAVLQDQKGSTKEWSRALGFERKGTSLLQHLVRFRNCKSTDPRDKVYALLGLPSISDDMHFHAPDYTLPTAAVFQETTRSIIKYENCLHVLCLQHPESQPRPYGLPSWCPNWAHLTFTEDSQPLIDVSAQQQAFRSSGTTIPQVRGDNINSDDRINGRDSRLTWAGNGMSLRGGHSFAKRDGFPLSNTYNVTTEQAQDKVLALDGIHCGAVLAAFEPVPSTAFDNDSQDWKEAVLSWDGKLASHGLIKADDPNGLRTMAEFISTILKGRARSPPPRTDGVDWQFVLFEKYLVWSGRIESEGARWADLHAKLDSIDEMVKGNVKNWTFGIVGEGTMAMLPSRSQAGDVIAVLFGGDVPFVLRPINDGDRPPDIDNKAEEGYFELIGTAYVHSQLMSGEALELLQAGQKGRMTFMLV